MTSGSLRLRLIAWGAVAIVAALFLAGLGLAQLFERHVVRSLGEDLELDLRQVLASIELDPDGRPVLLRQPSDPRFDQPLSGLYWQASTDEGAAARSRSLWDASVPLPDDAIEPGAVHRHQVDGPDGTSLLAVERLVLLKSGDRVVSVRVTVAADLARTAAARRSFIGELVPSLGLLSLALAAATWVQISLGLRPLQRLRDGVAAIRAGRARELGGPTPSEVEPLAEELNALLAAQAQELDRARGRAADLAHGLKTPLAALAADVRRLVEKGELEIAAEIEEISKAMRRHVEREMARARVQGRRRRAQVEATALRPLAQTLAAMQKRTPAGAALEIELAFSGAPLIAMDKADLAEVLGNLLENAVHHARSKVRIDVDESLRVSIEDDGPGIELSQQARMLERGERLDNKGPGAGLGLAIVQEVLDGYQRRLTLETSSLGGLKVTF